LPFVSADGGLATGEPIDRFDPTAVVKRAEALSRKEGHVGAVAFARSGDPATGGFGNAVVNRKFGTVPDDFSVMLRVRDDRADWKRHDMYDGETTCNALVLPVRR